MFSRPATESLANFLGLDSYLEGTVVVGQGGELRFVLPNGLELWCGEAPLGHAVACIPPEDVVLLTTVPDQSTSLRNVLQGTVKEVRPDGRLLRVGVASDGLEVAALVTKASFEELGPEPGRTRGRRLQGGRSASHPPARAVRTGSLTC